MNENIRRAILKFTGAKRFERLDVIQSLWSGYGEIVRLRLFYSPLEEDPQANAEADTEADSDRRLNTVVAKVVSLPETIRHPRGWNTDVSHQRKIRSYQVESHWYAAYAAQCDESCRVPHCYGVLEDAEQFVMVLEDLDAAGFSGRLDLVGELSDERFENSVDQCLNWLAHFHARFLQKMPQPEFSSGLWPQGSYWHLATRPDEFAALPEGDLKRYAASIDAKLRTCRWQTLVHGDAKLANFCFSSSNNLQSAPVAAVDFQYVGAGCGMVDVAYFFSSCFDENECQRLAPALLDRYFTLLRQAVKRYQRGLSDAELDDLESSWRSLYPLAWTDFYRFLQGWSPGHWKMHGYSEALAQQTLRDIKKQPLDLGHHLHELLATAIAAAKAAGKIISDYRDEQLAVRRKNLGGSEAAELLTQADIDAQALIESHLTPFSEQFSIAFVGEESVGEESLGEESVGKERERANSRFQADYSWLVDPIDGTLPFVEKREGYAVSIGLINQQGKPLLGVVYDVYHQRLYAAAQGCEIQLPEKASEQTPYNKNKLQCFLDASYVNDARYEAVIAKLDDYAKANGLAGVELVVGLGAALNAARVIENSNSVYIKLPKEKGGSIWDYAATAALFAASDLPVSDIYGEALDLNRADSTYMNHRGVFYASDSNLAAFILDGLNTNRV